MVNLVAAGRAGDGADGLVEGRVVIIHDAAGAVLQVACGHWLIDADHLPPRGDDGAQVAARGIVRAGGFHGVDRVGVPEPH